MNTPPAKARRFRTPPFVLVHGAWHGGWCWRLVADRLAKNGHEVYTPTLTGLADGNPVIDQNVGLDTHVADIVGLLESEGLVNAVLCGHSYAGFVIAGALEQTRSRVSSLVFVDAFIPENGRRLIDYAPAWGSSLVTAAEKGMVSVPAPNASIFVAERDSHWLNAKLTQQPIETFLQRITLSGAYNEVGKKTYVRATKFLSPVFDSFLSRARADPSWRIYEVPSEHDMMIDAPDRLSQILLEVA